MPELPDVEVFRRYLDATSLRRPIQRVEVPRPSMLEGVTPQQLEEALQGRHFVGSARYGKHLLAQTDGPLWLALHFGMTGFLRFMPAGQRDDGELVSHPRLVLHFRGGDALVFDDQRTFGSIGLARDLEEFIAERRLGPDALEADEDDFARALTGRLAIKAALMDQERLAGLGNVYADEVLFHARVHPAVSAGSLERPRVGRLHEVTGHVLRVAIDCEADPARMPDDFLLRRRRKGADCPSCKGKVAQTRIAGRTTYFCPACQKA